MEKPLSPTGRGPRRPPVEISNDSLWDERHAVSADAGDERHAAPAEDLPAVPPRDQAKTSSAPGTVLNDTGV
jgi:hypothetical protein